ncbi:MAG: 4-(cytidine 5'-diphospho)-2-C-methyl-D-erythritol kinase [Deltaproteobacteria bacterium]|nr:4-(cytidine 5'-diphospho)-2-C-methyl-D-erythritol kinase [Deltaproteobacteria bacterium]MBW2085408.1 4-(cytidine 5'-diphospho)-2-C-methyl-D-erythritol kinase [Deltaproteobacteria bacterium]
MLSPALSLLAPAKLNLHLSIVGRRSDGYHLLETLMVKLDLADRLLLVRRGRGIQFEVLGADLPADEDNMVIRAARAFFQATEFEPKVELRLEKHIPVAAGLGGGSSDAAAALKGLNDLYGSPLTQDRLFKLGLSLGADVPFFLFPGATALAKGIGELLSPGPELPEPCYFLLINPGWPLSTGWVYKNYKLKLTSTRKGLIYSHVNEGSFTFDRVMYNDLESVVMPRYPEVKAMKDQLLAHGAIEALMTGSGPTVFGVFFQRQDAERARTKLNELDRGKWVIIMTRNLKSPQF